MLTVVRYEEKWQWDSIATSFKNFDVYYLNGYVAGFKKHGDGEPLMFYYENGDTRGMYVTMLRDIALIDLFKGEIPHGEMFDLTSPYGYGGFIFEGKTSDDILDELGNELKTYMTENNIIASFTRFNPILNNAQLSNRFIEVVDLGNTISIDLSSKEVIWENFISQNRNKIRNAIKKDVKIHHTHKNLNLLMFFKELYDETMRNDNADKYYFFSREFYESIHRDLCNNYELFYATKDDRIIAMSIVLFANEKMHYHLSCSDLLYRSYNPSNLLLYVASLWGLDRGFKVFHLGGGLGATEDSLYDFKAAFNRNSDNRFAIGKQIFDSKKYNQLIELRKNIDPNFNINSSFFPLYRL